MLEHYNNVELVLTNQRGSDSMSWMLVISLLIPLLGTTLGSAMVFLLKDNINPKLQKILLGFASGVMIAASIWSLLEPAIDTCDKLIRSNILDGSDDKLNESIKKYIPMILSNTSDKSINKNERVLKESRKPTILTGENKNKKVAMNLEEDMCGLDVVRLVV